MIRQIAFDSIIVRVGMAVAIPVYSLMAFAAAFRTGGAMLMTAAGMLPIAGIVAWYQPFLICSLFVTFSYFRLQEAYPFLVPLKPALILGAASIGLVALKAMLSTDREVDDSRLLRTFCLISLIGVVAVAYPHTAIRGDGGHSIDLVAIPAVMLGASICMLLWTKFLSSTANAPLPINLWLFAAYFVWLSITTMLSLGPEASYAKWLNNPWKIASMTLAISWLARSSWDFLLSSTVYIFAGALVAAVVVYNKMHDISLVVGSRVSIGRIEYDDSMLLDASGIYALGQGQVLNDPNDLALILLFPLAFALARVFYRRGVFDAMVAAGMAALLIMAIVFTESRGALLGVLAVVAVLFLQRFKNLFLPALVILAIGSVLAVSALNLSSRGSLYVGGELEGSAGHRVEAWKTSINMAVANPLTGVGAGNFNEYYRTYTNYWRNREMSPHSMWFEVLAELGFVGLGLFIAMIVSSFVVNARTLAIFESTQAPASLVSVGIGLQAALAGTCVSGTFLSQAHTWPVYVLVGLIAALYNLAQQLPVSDATRRKLKETV